MMRLAFVVQRYGLEINGGAERQCREVVERLSPEFEIEVLTTCAQDYTTWENAYPAGQEVINGITVRRFPSIRTRSSDFGALSAWLYTHPHTLQDELNWLYAQGPVVPDLLRYIAERRLDYDVFIFFTYIYYPTALGLRLVADRALLVPTAHDEPSIYLDIYKALFHAPRAILYNTPEEKKLLEGLFDIEYIPNEIVGMGIEIPSHLDPDSFRHKYNITTPYVIYVGRVSPSKNCPTLVEYFTRYKAFRPQSPLTLVLVGRPEFLIPERADILALGFLSEEDKCNAIAGADLFILPSRYESLSIVFLESLAVGTPVLCDGTSAVLRGHCLRSNAALYYLNYPEFEASLDLLLENPVLRQKLGRNGMQYLRQNYTWDQVIRKYRYLINEVSRTPWW